MIKYDKYMLHNLISALIFFDATISFLKVSGSPWLVIWFQISTLVSTQHPVWSLKTANQTLNYLVWTILSSGTFWQTLQIALHVYSFFEICLKNFFFQNVSTVFLKSLTVLTKKDKKKRQSMWIINDRWLNNKWIRLMSWWVQ